MFDSKQMLDSKPLKNAGQARLLRKIGKLTKTPIYHQLTSTATNLPKYRHKNEICIRSFLKALFSDALNLNHKSFLNYLEIVKFITAFDEETTISVNLLSVIKNRIDKFSYTKHQVVRSAYSERFVAYVKIKFPDFLENEFLS